jgi:uncharacterized protein (DUF1501 family)
MKKVSLVVMSEFGRRIHENGGKGTDHGHGGGMLVMSGSLARGPVVAQWPGLSPDTLDRGEDLAITTDYRDVLTDILKTRLKNTATSEIFPNFQPTRLSLFQA